MKGRIVLACGGRNYTDCETVDRVLNAEHAESPIALLVHGDANGADARAGYWATSRGVHVAMVPALWGMYDRSAGPMRNTAIIRLWPALDLCIAFPGGKGTAHMVALCIAQGVPVRRVRQ